MPDNLAAVGNYFILRLDEPQVEGELLKALADLRPIGLQFSADSFLQDKPYEEWLTAHAARVSQCKELCGREQILLTIDHEGGRVHRLPPPITRFPYAFDWADRSEEVGRAMALELSSVGINVAFGPCVDIWSNKENKVIGPRSFGTSADSVSKAALPFLKSLNELGVMPCIKHFPGYGSESGDAHFSLPTVTQNLEELRRRELIPFKKCIAAFPCCVMTAHLMFPEVDREYPATLSPIFQQDLLRQELQYDGLVISDDLDMQAIKDNYSIADTARQILLAGIDLLVFNHYPARAVGLAQELMHLIDSEEWARAAFDRSQQRKEHFLRTQLNTFEIRQLDDTDLERHAELAASIPEKSTVIINEYEG